MVARRYLDCHRDLALRGNARFNLLDELLSQKILRLPPGLRDIAGHQDNQMIGGWQVNICAGRYLLRLGQDMVVASVDMDVTQMQYQYSHLKSLQASEKILLLYQDESCARTGCRVPPCGVSPQFGQTHGWWYGVQPRHTECEDRLPCWFAHRTAATQIRLQRGQCGRQLVYLRHHHG